MSSRFHPAALVVFVLLCFGSLNAQEQSGTIVFFREPHFLSGDFKPTLSCDNSELAQIQNGTYFEVSASAGLHLCNVDTSGKPPLEVNVQPGKPTYVHVELVSGITKAVLVNTSETEYSKQKSKLKSLAEWTRNSLAPKQIVSQSKLGTSSDDLGRFGDLAVNVTKLAISPSGADRSTFEAYVSTKNTGTAVICASLNASLKTTFDLEYRGASERAPRMREMLPNELADGVFRFDIKKGVQPLELTFTLNNLGNAPSIRCGINPAKEALPSDLHFDITTIPIEQTQQQVTNPSCIYCPEPLYTDAARTAKIQGVVVLQGTIEVNGRADNISVINGLGYGLDEAAIAAVRNWRFKPGMGTNGVPVPAATKLEINFRLLSR